MNRKLIWIYVLVIQLSYVCSRPAGDTFNTENTGQVPTSHTVSKQNEKVISVRITSSVAVARGNGKLTQKADTEPKKEPFTKTTTETLEDNENSDVVTDLPPNLRGANIAFLKQLNEKKESKHLPQEHSDNSPSTALRYDNDALISYETKNDQTNTNEEGIQKAQKVLSSEDFKSFRSKSISILDEALKLADVRLNVNSTDDEKLPEPFTENTYLSTLYHESEFNDDDKNRYDQAESNQEIHDIDDSIAESSIKSVLGLVNKDSEDYENIENVPLARSLAHSPSSKNYIQGSNNKPPSERESSTRLTTISFNIVHDAPKTSSFNDPGKPYVSPGQSFQEQHKFYDNPTIYSRPSQIYSEPAKIYSEPAKIYSEPSKIYSEPAKIYSEPAKVYSVPAKYYSEPASLHLKPSAPSLYPPWQSTPPSTPTTLSTTPVSSTTVSDSNSNQHQPERNFEVDEQVSVLTQGRTHGKQESSTEKCKQENCKVGYVVKGRQFNKYRVEERTSDGFIVGEYGVVRNEDGALRGVRYTADSEASPRLIYDALMKFLQLK